jgi:hypothetical protein
MHALGHDLIKGWRIFRVIGEVLEEFLPEDSREGRLAAANGIV